MKSGSNQSFLQCYQTPLFLFLVTAAGFFCRVYGLGEWDYYHDEIWHVYVARQSTLADVFYINLAEDGHPILGYFLWHWLLNIWNDPWMARMPSLVAGTLCIPAGYLLGKELFQSRNAGLFFAFFCAFSFLVIIQSNVVRGYVPMFLFSMLSVWSVYRYKEKLHLFYVLLYFIFTSIALLFEFAAAPAVAFTALHSLYSIYRHAHHKMVPLIIWVVIHIAWLLYLWIFSGLLKTIGGIDFSQSHIFFDRDIQPLLHTFAQIITFFLEYINAAGFFWGIGLVTQSESLITVPLLFFLIISIVGIVSLFRQRAWDLLLLIALLIIIALGFYWFKVVPLSSPRRSMTLLLVFMILFYAGLRHCVVHLPKKKFYKLPSIFMVLTVTTLVFSAAYIVYGKEWRRWRVVEFQQTRERAVEITQFLQENVDKKDLIIMDRGSSYHLWLRNGQPNYKLLGKHVGRLGTSQPGIFISPSDLRMKSFISEPFEMQEMFREMDRMKLFEGVKKVWLVGIQHTNVKSIIIDPTYRFYLNAVIPYAARQLYKNDIQKIIDGQELLARNLYTSALQKKIYFTFNCGDASEIVIGEEHPCVVSSAMLEIPVKVIYDNFINAPDCLEPEKLLLQIRRELSTR